MANGLKKHTSQVLGMKISVLVSGSTKKYPIYTFSIQ